MRDESYYWELVRGRFNETNSLEQEKELTEWINESESNRIFYNQCRVILAATEIKEPQFEEEHSWQTLISKEQAVPMHSRKVWLVRLAAVVAVCLVTYLFLDRDNAVRIAAVGNDISTTLPDNSTVLLNAGSTLSYEGDFGDTARNVALAGEAFFDVQKDASKPFIIQTANTNTLVVGTSFKLKTDGDRDELTVVTGLVKISSRTGSSEVFAEAGSSVTVRDDGVTKVAGMNLSFNRTALEDVIQTMEVKYGIDIRLDVRKGNCRFTGSFATSDFNDVLEALSLTLGLEVKVEDGQIVLSGEGCNE